VKIAVWHNLPSGGGKRALYDHVTGLLARGHTVESWCPPTADQAFLPLGNLVVEHVVPLDVVQPGSWKATVGSLSGGATRVFATLKAMDDHSRRCAQEIEQGGFDLLFAGSCEALGVTSLARHVAIPSLLYLQEPCRRLYEALPDLPWPAQGPSGRPVPVAVARRLRDVARTRALRVQAREELEGVRAYGRVLANSYFSRESMLRAYGIAPKVCYLGVDTERYRDLGLQRERRVVGIGAFAHHKRVEVVIEAVAQIREQRPELVWVGNSVQSAYLRDLENLAARKQVTFTPLVAVSHDALARVLNEAAVMACVSRLEPFGYGPLEAGACGLPVVAVAEGGIRETVIDGETGFLVDNEADLSRALERVLDDEALAHRLGATARFRIESQWSLPAAIDRLESHLFELIEGKERSAPTSA
jgi:glycosyltransferase involved in cell wall biosynthesis